jgi:Transposase DDE domain group 1
MIVVRNKAIENSFHRITDQRERTVAHLLGTIAALLAPLLEPQIDAGPANPEALGHNARPLSLITGFKRTAAKIIGVGFGHGISPLNLRFLNPPNRHAFRSMLKTQTKSGWRSSYQNLCNGAFMRTLALPQSVEHWSLATLRDKLVKIGAKVVRHGRYVTFQLAEVAVSRTLFAEILRLIGNLRPRPAPI